MIGRAAGVPIVLGPGWLFASLLLVAVFGPTASAAIPGIGRLAGFLVAAGWAVLLYGSILLHELAHAYAGRARGVPVRQVTLTLIGGHTEMDDAGSPGTSAFVAAAGPLTNLVVAGVAGAAAAVVPPWGAAAWLLVSLAGANVVVTVFNLLPGLPMDGGWILEALVWRLTGRRASGTVAAAWIGRVVGVGLVAATLVVPVLRGEAPAVLQVAWAAFVGAMLWTSAGAFLRRAAGLRALGGLDVARLARPAAVVPTRGTLADALAARALVDGADDVIAVGPDGRPLGYADLDAVATVPVALHASTPLPAVLVPMHPDAVVDAGPVGEAAAGAIARASRLSPVMAVRGTDGSLCGLLRHADVVTALRARN
ncbi:peptidase M50 [Actinotalea fermentans]|uniref:Peptidase M50 n=1 Tax=Actinotalea fermentans TaxID=43671 RepID=A0A511YV86_9CELL|nr:peptidase M50 [Actinotalea fermentans]